MHHLVQINKGIIEAANNFISIEVPSSRFTEAVIQYSG